MAHGSYVLGPGQEPPAPDPTMPQPSAASVPSETAQPRSLSSMLRALAPGARPSDVWRSTAFTLVRLDPNECESLAELFEEESATDEVRTLVLDTLAGAGTREAQIVARRLLALAVARRDRGTFAMFIQRLGFLESPDGPTLRFLMSVYAESRGEPREVRAACSYALGAAAGHALASGDAEAAERATDVLRRDLLGAATDLERCALLAALGNAGVVADVPLIAPFTQCAASCVRAAAALALRKMNVPEARGHLISLLVGHEKVAQSALVALAEHKLAGEDVETLAELVLSGRTSVRIDGLLLQLLVAQRTLLTPSAGSARMIEKALRVLLARIEAAGASAFTGSGERRSSSRVREAALAPSVSAPAPSPRTESVAAVGIAATVLARPLERGSVASGSYRIVSPCDPVEIVPDRVIALGPRSG